MEYVLAEILEVFDERFGERPGFDPDLGIGLFGPLVSRDVAIAAARALFEIDERRRDPDVELAYHVMTS